MLKVARLVATEFVQNDDPIGKIEVDHLDGIWCNDVFDNLEWVTPTEQQRRRTERMRRQGKTSSRFVGVSWVARDKKWCAQVWVDRKRIHIGYFRTEIEAAVAYNEFVQSNGYNFPLNAC